ncbi:MULTISPECIES: UbiA family prenyltransferase [Halorussus]|uniref:UbiA family prenyltransferase n=1 Tax=Halorussus TaxID=1070314 RepID=UPI000E21979A|nr:MULTISPECIES: UbiA family prenyltransferase [Halorussus]NHN61638.1 UbiA family prenyltransferase [Halorussus sp. JP-T4]
MTDALGRSRGLLTQVKPTFMAPAVATSVAGGLLAPAVAPLPAAGHALAVGAALYVAHLVDEYVDAHVRGEDDPSVPRGTLTRAVAATSVLFWLLVALLWAGGARAGALAAVPLWALAVAHAPALDRHPVPVTVDYPVGIGLALAGGYLTQTGALPVGVVGMAAVLAVALSGVKVSVDRLDFDADRAVGKRTVPVLVGDRRAAVVSAGVHVLAGATAAGFVATGVLPSPALWAVPFPLAAGAAGLAASRRRTVGVQIAAVYPLAGVLVLARCGASGCALGSYATDALAAL